MKKVFSLAILLAVALLPFTGLKAQTPTGFNPNTYEPTYGPTEADSLQIVEAFYAAWQLIPTLDMPTGDTTFTLGGKAWEINSEIGNLLCQKNENLVIGYHGYVITDTSTGSNFLAYYYDNSETWQGQVWLSPKTERLGNWSTKDTMTWFLQVEDRNLDFSDLNNEIFPVPNGKQHEQLDQFIENLKAEDYAYEKYSSLTIIIITQGQSPIDALDQFLRQAGVEGPKPEWEESKDGGYSIEGDYIFDNLEKENVVAPGEYIMPVKTTACPLYQQLDSLLKGRKEIPFNVIPPSYIIGTKKCNGSIGRGGNQNELIRVSFSGEGEDGDKGFFLTPACYVRTQGMINGATLQNETKEEQSLGLSVFCWAKKYLSEN